MTRGLNKVMLIGWLERDPEVRHSPTGRSVALFTVAAPRAWVSAEGQRRQEVEWFSVVAWGALAEICEKRLTHGQRLYIEGRLQTRSWLDEKGNKHFRTEVVAQEIIALDEPLADVKPAAVMD